MRRVLSSVLLAVLLVSALCASTALADATPTIGTSVSEVQPCVAGTCARSAAPTSALEGLSLGFVRGYSLMVCAATGQTLSGAGILQAYWCDSRTGVCARQPDADQTVTASGAQCQAFAPFLVPNESTKQDSVVFAASGVTVSGGAGLTVYLYPAS